MLDVRSLNSADAVVIEFVAKRHSKITKGEIKTFACPTRVNIWHYSRWKRVIAYGNTHIQEGDHVIVFCSATKVRKVEALFN